MRSHLFPFFLLAILVPIVGADSVWQDGDATGPLVGGFDAQLRGQFVQVSHAAQRLDVDLGDRIVTIHKSSDAPLVQGPLADFGDVQIHDNVYQWIHVQGDFTMDAKDVEPIARGLRVDDAYLVARDLQWDHAGGVLSVQATDTLISNDGGFQNLGPDPSAWALLQADDDGVVMDWFAFGGAPFATDSIGEEVVMNLVGTIGDDAPDVLVRLEQSGHFADRADRFVLMAGTLAARHVPADDMLNARGAFSFHARDAGHQIVDLRLPEGLSGEARWRQDLQAPAFVDATIEGIDPYVPLQRSPQMTITWDEPVLGTLLVGEQTKQTTSPAYELTFRLTGLQPDTAYAYTLHVQDLAGNPATHEGTFTTGPREGPSAQIQILGNDPTDDGHVVHFLATLDDGTPAPAALVHAFIDKQPATDRLMQQDDVFQIAVPADASELRIEVNAPAGRVSEVLAFEPDQQSPGPGLWIVALGLLVMARRR